MKSFDYKKARQFLENKEEKREIILNERYRRAQHDFQRIIKKILDNCYPKRIYQWGSLLNRKSFTEISDIDIALEGITSAAEFFKIYGDIMNMTNFSIDLIQIEKIEPEFAELIKEKGIIVYERKRKSSDIGE